MRDGNPDRRTFHLRNLCKDTSEEHAGVTFDVYGSEVIWYRVYENRNGEERSEPIELGRDVYRGLIQSGRYEQVEMIGGADGTVTRGH